MGKEISDVSLYAQIAELLHAARQTAVRAVNQAMVCTYYEIGRMIVEDEQQGKERAAYCKKVLKELSEKLTADFGKGFSVDNLERMKKFYLMHSDPISATPLRKLQGADNKDVTVYHPSNREFVLSWSHYLNVV